MKTMKLCLLSMSCLCSLLSSCTATTYQTTASLLSSLSQSAATVLAARYQVASPPSYAGGGDYNQMSLQGYAPNYGGFDYSQQMPSQRGYAPNYQTASYPNNGYYQQQQPMLQPMPMPPPMQFCPQQQGYYPAYY
jgi:hypothetical protein